MNKLFFVAIAAFILSSCEKDINLNLNNVNGVLVVDASIENDKPPVVVLTKSFSFFSSITPQLLDSAFVHNAVVTISNGVDTQQLKEYSVPIVNNYNYFYYTIDSNNVNAFKGQLNTAYSLTVTTEGQTYTSSTTIPAFGEILDSMWWKKMPYNDDTTAILLSGKFTDPKGLGDYCRYFTKTNNGGFLPGYNSVFNDQVIDGTTYSFQIDPGVDRNNPIPLDSNYFKRGDTITVKLADIDKSTYTFWNTWEFAYRSIGNPFAQPNKVIGNISNGALGAFYGYAADYKTLIVPK
ncbi:DUF4249 family protein [Ferruginibacter albus]|uniref:DUF4249 family protein n=1 Tax=Ferruginibacter albus TaxID=2875540 RepID=UPI001CC6D474|nr:DUF4249 family protein [Ferruginibacter albus]UAY50719.1 DUF4249 domain-containing protein [Ferruginibacter albus]